MAAKSAASPAGSGTMSTVPSSAEEIRRSSADLPVGADAPAVAAEHALAQADRRVELLGGLVLVLAVGEQDGVPQRGRMRCEHLVRQAQPLPDRGSAARPQAGHGLLRRVPGLLVGDGQAAVGREDRLRLLGARDHGEGHAVADHVHGRRGGRPGLGDLGPRRAHRPGAVDDDDLRAAGVRRPGAMSAVSAGRHRDDGVDVLAAFGRYSFW